MFVAWYHIAPSVCWEGTSYLHTHTFGRIIYQRRERHYSVCFLTQVFLGPKATDRQSESSRSFCILRSTPTKSFQLSIAGSTSTESGMLDWYEDYPCSHLLNSLRTGARVICTTTISPETTGWRTRRDSIYVRKNTCRNTGTVVVVETSGSAIDWCATFSTEWAAGSQRYGGTGVFYSPPVYPRSYL